MPPTDRFVISFAASPPQESLPYGRWGETLAEHFRSACERIDAEGEDLGEPGEIVWFPDRCYAGRTYVPAVARTSGGYELFGYVSFRERFRAESAPGERTPGTEEAEEGAPKRAAPGRDPAQPGAPHDFAAQADFTAELAEANPDWKLDLNDEVIGSWRGEHGNVADITLVWGAPLIPGGAIVTAELANLAVDQCELVDDRFTLIAPDNYRQDFLEIKLWSKRGQELAAESLYVEDE